MHIGSKLLAPEGYLGLRAHKAYHLLAHQREHDRVLLVYYNCQRKKKRRRERNQKSKAITLVYSVRILSMPVADFEAGFAVGHIVAADDQPTLPPWLSELEGHNLALLDQGRSRKESNWELIQSRKRKIDSALRELDQILAARDVARAINRHAARVDAVRSRYRLWLITYLVFGRNDWVLTPRFHVIGRWDRQTASGASGRLGRKSLAGGRDSGHRLSAQDISDLVAGYYKFREKKRPLTKIFLLVIEEYWKAKLDSPYETTYSGDVKRFPVPTLHQFRYRVHQQVGADQVYYDRHGEQRTRNRRQANRGKTSENLTNLMERVEWDAYSTEEHPVGLDGEILPPLYVVKICDVQSGMLIGIGFSLGSETASAYQAALFCAAVDKVYFASLLGITLKEQDWPCIGLPSGLVGDGGAGASKALEGVVEAQTRVPAYTGQSKPNVESGNPRNDHAEGAPVFWSSGKSPVQLSAQELIRAVELTHTSDAKARLTVEMNSASVEPTPHGIWNFQDIRGRNNASMVGFADAVRQYLQPIELSVRKDGVYYHDLRYDSAPLRDTGLIDRAASHRLPATGYLLPMCIRRLWVEVGGELIEVECRPPTIGDRNTLAVTDQQLKDVDRLSRISQSDFRRNTVTKKLYYRALYEEATGLKMDSAAETSGRAPMKTPQSRMAAASIGQVMEGK